MTSQQNYSHYRLNSLQMKIFTIYYLISCANRKKGIILKIFDFKKKGICHSFDFIVYILTDFLYVIENFLRLQIMFCIGNNNNTKKTFHMHQVQTFITVNCMVM